MTGFDFWNKSLMARLVLSFLLLSVAMVSLVGTVAFLQARDTLKQAAFERLQVVLELKEAELNRWVNQQLQEVLFLANAPQLQDLVQNLIVIRNLPQCKSSWQALKTT
ncbi:MAG: hypothetical protein HC837_06975 [Chloroflexaceae bacterium]|nr:hypothetical protein [Chloroflexaceae bacterium]